MFKLLFSILFFVALVSAASKSLTIKQYVAAASRLGIKELALLKAVDTVESGGNGFLKSGKPKILFERHLFRHFTSPVGRWDKSHPDISNPTPGGYFGGEREWLRFNKAAKLNNSAAIKASSWGRFQILGEWYKVCKYSSPAKYAAAMKINEGYHLNCLVDYLKASGLVPALSRHNWAAFARGYNGPAYAKNHYDVKLANAYAAAVKAGWNKHKIPVARADVAASDSADIKSSSHLSAGVVAAIVVGCVVAAVALVAVVAIVIAKQNRDEKPAAAVDYRAYAVNDSA